MQIVYTERAHTHTTTWKFYFHFLQVLCLFSSFVLFFALLGFALHATDDESIDVWLHGTTKKNCNQVLETFEENNNFLIVIQSYRNPPRLCLVQHSSFLYQNFVISQIQFIVRISCCCCYYYTLMIFFPFVRSCVYISMARMYTTKILWKIVFCPWFYLQRVLYVIFAIPSKCFMCRSFDFIALKLKFRKIGEI